MGRTLSSLLAEMIGEDDQRVPPERIAVLLESRELELFELAPMEDERDAL